MNETGAPISAVVITLNAESLLQRVLAPLAFCAEIVVLDSGSGDRTVEIAEACGARVREHPFDGYGPQKRRAVELAVHDWIIAVDADEILDQRAADAMAAIDWARQDPRCCWRINRRPFVGEREVRHGHWVPDRLVRVFNRRVHTYDAGMVHASVRASGPTRMLPGSLLHYSYRDMADIFRMDYHRMKADEYRRRGQRASGPALALRAMARFFHSYVLKRGFLDGRLGVVIAAAGAVNAMLGLAMASECDSPGDQQRAGDT